MEFYDGGFVEDKAYMKKHSISVDKVNTVRKDKSALFCRSLVKLVELSYHKISKSENNL